MLVDERLMTLRTSLVAAWYSRDSFRSRAIAVCCSNACASSRLSAAFSWRRSIAGFASFLVARTFRTVCLRFATGMRATSP